MPSGENYVPFKKAMTTKKHSDILIATYLHFWHPQGQC
jgi:hypothetical protein